MMRTNGLAANKNVASRAVRSSYARLKNRYRLRAVRPARSGLTSQGAPNAIPTAMTRGPPIGNWENQRPLSSSTPKEPASEQHARLPALRHLVPGEHEPREAVPREGRCEDSHDHRRADLE